MDGLKIEDKLRDLEKFIGKSFVNRIDCVSADIANDFNYRSSYAADISDTESTKIGLTSDWYHLFYNKHSNINGFGIEIAFPLNNPSNAPKYRNAINGVWQSWKNINDGGNADKLDGYHASNFLLKSGGTMTGALNFANGTWNLVGDDAYIGDCNIGGCIGIKGNNANTGLYFAPYSGSVAQTITTNGAGTMTITGTVAGSFSGNLSGTVNNLETYKLETLAANGGRHGTSHYMYCKHNTYNDGRFALLMEQGHEIRVHCASHLQGFYPRNVYQDAAYIPLTGNMPLEIGTWIDFHKTSSTADFDGRLYFDTTNGGLCWNDTINPTAYNMNISWEIHNLKQSVANGKQAVVNAINNKLGYASGLTTQNTGSDYAWWINNKIEGRQVGISVLHPSTAMELVYNDPNGGQQYKTSFSLKNGFTITFYFSYWSSQWYLTHIGGNKEFKAVVISGLEGGHYNGGTSPRKFFMMNGVIHNSAGDTNVTNYGRIPISAGHGNEQGYRSTGEIIAMFSS